MATRRPANGMCDSCGKRPATHSSYTTTPATDLCDVCDPLPTGRPSRRRTVMTRRMGPLRSAEQFFYEYAGYGYDPKRETKEQGRRRGAKTLAHAESEASERGWRTEWLEDEESWSLRRETPDVQEWYVALLRDENGKVISSLGAIGDPDRNYRRVVEAELAFEALAETDKRWRGPGARRRGR